MNDSQELPALTVPDNLRWLADGDRVLIVDQQAERSWLLGGRAALLWARLPQTNSVETLAKDWMLLHGEDRADSEKSLRRYLEGWLADGLLVAVEDQA